MRQYFRRSRIDWCARILLVAAWFATAAGLTTLAVHRGDPDVVSLEPLPVALWYLIGLAILWQLAREAFELGMTGDGVIVARSLLGRSRIPARDATTIKMADKFAYGFEGSLGLADMEVWIRFAGRTLSTVLNVRLAEFIGFVEAVQALNPSVQLRHRSLWGWGRFFSRPITLEELRARVSPGAGKTEGS